MRSLLKYLLSILFYLFTLFALSQTTYRGTVYSELDSLTLAGVSIKEVGTSNAVTTDFNGNFTIESNTNRLVFSYIGMLSKEVLVTNKSDLKIFLSEDEIKVVMFFPTHRNLWFTIGTSSDIINAPFGISIGNGIEEENHLHFEDHTHRITYNFYYAQNFENKNQMYGGKIRLTYIKGLKQYSSFLEPTIEYDMKKYANITFENFTFSSNLYYLNSLKLRINTKVGYQKFNFNENYGFVIGINQLKYGRYNLGINVGFWNDYISFESYIRKFLYKKKIMSELKYQKIKESNFITLNFNYLFSIRKKIVRK